MANWILNNAESATSIESFLATETTSDVVSSATYVTVGGMSLTPWEWKYFFAFSSSWSPSAAGTTRNIALFINGTIRQVTQRQKIDPWFFGAGAYQLIENSGIIDIGAWEVVDIRAKAAAWTITFTEREFALIKLQ